MFLRWSYFLIKRPLKREFYGEVHSHGSRTRCRIGFGEQPKWHFLASLRAFHYLIPTWLLHLTSSSNTCQILSRNTLKHHSYQSCRYLQHIEHLFFCFPCILRRSLLLMPRFADYLASWCLQNVSFREKFTATYGSRTRCRVGFNESTQSDGEHGGLGAPAPLNPPCSFRSNRAC